MKVEKVAIVKERLDVFFSTLEPLLVKNIEKNPEKFGYPVSDVARVLASTKQKVEVAGTFLVILKDTDTIKATCKVLGIKHTYTAINAFLAGVAS